MQKHRFPHLLVAGIARHIPQAKRTDSKKKFIKKTSVKPFVKYVNQNHVLPTRFQLNDFDLKDIKDENLKTKEARLALRRNLRDSFSSALRNLQRHLQVLLLDLHEHARQFDVVLDLAAAKEAA